MMKNYLIVVFCFVFAVATVSAVQCPAQGATDLFIPLNSNGPYSQLTSPANLIASTACQYWAAIQSNGNLVVYRGYYPSMTPLWSSGTTGVGTGPYTLNMQGDGNLVLYDAHGTPTWDSGTGGKPEGSGPWQLQMQTDGNLVLINARNGKPKWASNTGGQ